MFLSWSLEVVVKGFVLNSDLSVWNALQSSFSEEVDVPLCIVLGLILCVFLDKLSSHQSLNLHELIENVCELMNCEAEVSTVKAFYNLKVMNTLSMDFETKKFV